MPAANEQHPDEGAPTGSNRLSDRVKEIVRSSAVPDLLHRLRHLPDQRLHDRRRIRALETVERAPIPSLVLFVCHGNLYRSPFAQHAFELALPEALRGTIRTVSAGFVGPPRASPEPAVRFAASRGVDLSAHRSALLTAPTAGAASLVVVMEPIQKRAILERFGGLRAPIVLLGDFDPERIRTRTIPDPWDQTPEVLQQSYLRIERCARVLAGVVSRGEPVGRP